MSSLVNAIQEASNDTVTTNGMRAKRSTMSDTVDLFFKIGASRGQDIIPLFAKALAQNEEVAMRIALWSRDIRGGAGERQLFRDVLVYLANTDYKLGSKVLHKVPELGRWDDLLVLVDTPLQSEAFDLIHRAIIAGDALCAKWMPRKGDVAVKLRNHMDMTPKQYRKTLVSLSNTVETLMCAKQWGEIQYDKIPSVASARYQKAFGRNDTDRYVAYLNALTKGETKINAGAVYPYDVTRSLKNGNVQAAEGQWKALPDYVPEGKTFLPIVDVSCSMGCSAGGSGSLTCMDVAVSLGLYLSERNKSVFKDSFITFSERPELQKVSGNLAARHRSMVRANWGMSTNLESVFDLVLKAAVKGKVAQEDMPDTLIILSDMQFNQCVHNSDHSAFKMIRKSFERAGYKMPNLVFWNINAHDNAPVKFDKEGTALVSGFSPSIMKNLLSGKDMTPETIMLETVMDTRYSY